MAQTKDQKKAVIQDLSTAFSTAGSVVFVHFNGISVEDTTQLRKNLREENVGYRVAKKTLIGRALGEQNFEGVIPPLDGNIAVAWSADSIAPARVVHAFRKGREGNLVLAGGVFENRYMSAEEITSIATIPSMQVLRGMFVNVINSPIQGFVMALNQIAEKKSA